MKRLTMAEMLERRARNVATCARLDLADALDTLARNLRDAAGCALAWQLHRDFEWSWRYGDAEAWCQNIDGKPAPGWER